MEPRIFDGGVARMPHRWAWTAEPPETEGRYIVWPRANPIIGGTAFDREFKLRDGEWVCEHPAWPTGFDSWATMAGRGWVRVVEWR